MEREINYAEPTAMPKIFQSFAAVAAIIPWRASRTRVDFHQLQRERFDLISIDRSLYI